MAKKKNEKPSPDSRLCFVVMGFGKKTDYETGRTLDLNATYNEIIKPAVTKANLRCVRADEVMHSGAIDLPMFEMLLRADLVIADISTGNANALYELGVRHALRPYSTLVMTENKGKLYFDLNHINTFSYSHLGEDIGASEARRAKVALKLLIEEIMARNQPDSPVYTFLPRLVQPKLSDDEFEALVSDKEAIDIRFSNNLTAGEAAIREDRFEDAIQSLDAALSIKPNDPYLMQQLALATYKSKKPTAIAALVAGLKIIYSLDPQNSNDPETLGIAGAIHRRIWEATKDGDELKLATSFYARGFEIRKDYYNGENYALCLNLMASRESDVAEKTYLNTSARKVRERLLGILMEIIGSEQFPERSDKKWVFATMANVYFSLNMIDDGEKYEKLFLSEKDKDNLADWEVETYQKSKSMLLALLL